MHAHLEGCARMLDVLVHTCDSVGMNFFDWCQLFVFVAYQQLDIFLYACMCVCMSVYKCVCLCVFVCVCVSLYVNVSMYACTYACIHVCACIWAPIMLPCVCMSIQGIHVHKTIVYTSSKVKCMAIFIHGFSTYLGARCTQLGYMVQIAFVLTHTLNRAQRMLLSYVYLPTWHKHVLFHDKTDTNTHCNTAKAYQQHVLQDKTDTNTHCNTTKAYQQHVLQDFVPHPFLLSLTSKQTAPSGCHGFKGFS
jgi:hypothetical protein